MGGREKARSLNDLETYWVKLAGGVLNGGWQNSALIIVMLISVIASTTAMGDSKAINESLQNTLSAQCFSDAKAAYAVLLAEESRQATTQQEAIDNAKVNINSATEGELASLKGIGSSKAQEIILYREMFGDFARVEDLTRVKGIGDKTVKKNRHRLRVQ